MAVLAVEVEARALVVTVEVRFEYSADLVRKRLTLNHHSVDEAQTMVVQFLEVVFDVEMLCKSDSVRTLRSVFCSSL